MLRSHKAEQEKQMLKTHNPLCEDDFVFCHGDGRPYDPNTITGAYSKILERAGLPHMRFHDLRHTHATLMLMAGIHPKIVSERLGHSKIAITLDIYSHIVPRMQEAAAESFDQLLKAKAGEAESVSKMLAK